MYKIKPPYSLHQASFSKIILKVEQSKFCVGLNQLFKTDAISDCPKIECEFQRSPGEDSEAILFFDVANQFLSKLGDVTLGLNQTKRLKAYKDQIGFSTMKADKLGIGDAEIWYGKPDARIRANGADTAVVCPVSPDANGESDGETIVIEAKKELGTKFLAQEVVSTSIVHSFTEHHNHPGLNPMVPILFVNGTKLQVVMYHCQQDVLLLSNQVVYRTHSGLQRAGFFWVVGCVAGSKPQVNLSYSI